MPGIPVFMQIAKNAGCLARQEVKRMTLQTKLNKATAVFGNACAKFPGTQIKSTESPKPHPPGSKFGISPFLVRDCCRGATLIDNRGVITPAYNHSSSGRTNSFRNFSKRSMSTFYKISATDMVINQFRAATQQKKSFMTGRALCKDEAIRKRSSIDSHRDDSPSQTIVGVTLYESYTNMKQKLAEQHNPREMLTSTHNKNTTQGGIEPFQVNLMSFDTMHEALAKRKQFQTESPWAGRYPSEMETNTYNYKKEEEKPPARQRYYVYEKEEDQMRHKEQEHSRTVYSFHPHAEDKSSAEGAQYYQQDEDGNEFSEGIKNANATARPFSTNRKPYYTYSHHERKGPENRQSYSTEARPKILNSGAGIEEYWQKSAAGKMTGMNEALRVNKNKNMHAEQSSALSGIRQASAKKSNAKQLDGKKLNMPQSNNRQPSMQQSSNRQPSMQKSSNRQPRMQQSSNRQPVMQQLSAKQSAAQQKKASAQQSAVHRLDMVNAHKEAGRTMTAQLQAASQQAAQKNALNRLAAQNANPRSATQKAYVQRQTARPTVQKPIAKKPACEKPTPQKPSEEYHKQSKNIDNRTQRLKVPTYSSENRRESKKSEKRSAESATDANRTRKGVAHAAVNESTTQAMNYDNASPLAAVIKEVREKKQNKDEITESNVAKSANQAAATKVSNLLLMRHSHLSHLHHKEAFEKNRNMLSRRKKSMNSSDRKSTTSPNLYVGNGKHFHKNKVLLAAAERLEHRKQHSNGQIGQGDPSQRGQNLLSACTILAMRNKFRRFKHTGPINKRFYLLPLDQTRQMQEYAYNEPKQPMTASKDAYDDVDN